MVNNNKKIDESSYGKFSFLFEVQKIEDSLCLECEGIEHCKLQTNGWKTRIIIDSNNFPVEEKVPCNYRLQQKLVGSKIIYSNMPAAFQNLCLGQIKRTLKDEKEDYQKTVDTCIDNIQKKKGIYLSGKPGVGKTFFLASVWNDLSKGSSSHTKMAFANVPAFLEDLKRTFDKGNRFEEMMTSIKQADILVLDDLGSEQITSWSRDQILFSILDYRMNNGLYTCFSSNCPVHKLVDIYSPKKSDAEIIAATRLVERIKTLSVEVVMSGESRRHE